MKAVRVDPIASRRVPRAECLVHLQKFYNAYPFVRKLYRPTAFANPGIEKETRLAMFRLFGFLIKEGALDPVNGSSALSFSTHPTHAELIAVDLACQEYTVHEASKVLRGLEDKKIEAAVWDEATSFTQEQWNSLGKKPKEKEDLNPYQDDPVHGSW